MFKVGDYIKPTRYLIEYLLTSEHNSYKMPGSDLERLSDYTARVTGVDINDNTYYSLTFRYENLPSQLMIAFLDNEYKGSGTAYQTTFWIRQDDESFHNCLPGNPGFYACSPPLHQLELPGIE